MKVAEQDADPLAFIQTRLFRSNPVDIPVYPDLRLVQSAQTRSSRQKKAKRLSLAF
jgi:hypothetical protein